MHESNTVLLKNRPFKLMGTKNPKTPLLHGARSRLHLIHLSLHQRHPDQISLFATVHPRTDRPTDRQKDRPRALTLYYIGIERLANNY